MVRSVLLSFGRKSGAAKATGSNGKVHRSRLVQIRLRGWSPVNGFE